MSVLGALLFLSKAGIVAGLSITLGLCMQRFALGARHLRIQLAATCVLVVALAIRLLLLNAELAGGIGQALDFEMFAWIWEPNRAQILTLVGGSLSATAAVCKDIRALYGIAAALLAWGVGAAGHTQALAASGLAPVVVSAHVLLASFWLTAPIVLWPARELSRSTLVIRLRRFSAVALWAVPLLFLAGGWLTWRLVDPITDVTATSYGRLLLAKLALATGALAIGAANKYFATVELGRNEGRGRVWLRRLLFIDVLLFTGIALSIAGATSLTGPGMGG